MSNLYDAEYYEYGQLSGKSLYKNYTWLPELTIPMCAEMIYQLGIREGASILDFGCAKGYTVKAFRLLHRESFGVDISEYAIESAPEDVRPFLYLLGESGKIPLLCKGNRYDWIIVKDVLEHLEESSLRRTLLELLRVGGKFFIIVPLGDGKRYIIPEYEGDVTHKIRQTLSWWESIFLDVGFIVDKATYRVSHIKSNWEHYEKGNGFFILGSREV